MELADIKYFDELKEVMSESEIEIAVKETIKNMKGLINEKTALYVIASKKGLVKREKHESSEFYSCSRIKAYHRRTKIHEEEWINIKDVIVITEPEIKSGVNKKGDKWKLTTIEVCDGIENKYGRLDFVKISTFMKDFDLVTIHRQITVKNVLLSHRLMPIIDEISGLPKKIHYSAVSYNKNSSIEFPTFEPKAE